MATRIANHVVIDHMTHCLYIDEFRFPFLITEVPQIERLDGSMSAVHIGIIADNVHVMRSLDQDLTWIREFAKMELAEAKREFLNKNPIKEA